MKNLFLPRSKFALLAIENAYTSMPADPFRLSDGTWVTSGMPVDDLGSWERWLGSLRIGRLRKSNVVVLAQEPSDAPSVLDAVHQKLGRRLRFFSGCLHLNAGIECEPGGNLLLGSCENGVPEVRQVADLARFLPSLGYRRIPITRDMIEDASALGASYGEAFDAHPDFRRFVRGMLCLAEGLKHETAEDRIHQFVRALEALILPDPGKTTKQFADRCQTFAGAGEQPKAVLEDAFDMRSAAEHLHDWDSVVQCDLAGQWQFEYWERTRQMQRLASDVYARILRDPGLRNHFRNNESIAKFWQIRDGERREIWGAPFDILMEPPVREYDGWGRAAGV